MEKMEGRTVDAAFVPLDPRLEQWFYLGMKEFMEKVDAKAVIPMHFWKDYSIIEKMRQHPSSEDGGSVLWKFTEKERNLLYEIYICT